MREDSLLSIFAATVNSNIVIRLEGRLDVTNYVRLRDSIFKFAIEEPSGIIIDVSELETRDAAAWALFTRLRWQLSRLPDMPVALVCVKDRDAEAIHRMNVSRYVPVFPTIQAAIRAVTDGHVTYRYRPHTVLPPDDASDDQSRTFVATP
jgi:anti-anti-sigma factor